MTDIISIEPAIDPNARPTFLLDWELTMKCNLDCSYCDTEGLHASHNNSTNHPPLNECLRSVDFMFEYVDLYMAKKPSWNRAAVLNIYGGESLFHPDIVEILKYVRTQYQSYKDRWPLKVTTTTNAVVGPTRMDEIIPFIDEFTVSYHAESLPKQKKQVLDNLQKIKKSGKALKCIVLMHGDHSHWPELTSVIEFCKNHDINYLARQIDGKINSTYNEQQITWFKKQWVENSPSRSRPHQENIIKPISKIIDPGASLSGIGRACCGGRLMCVNGELKNPVFYSPKVNFQGWSCSVNWYFVFVKQLTGDIYVNKDCKMNFDGTVSPIGNLRDYQTLIADTKAKLDAGIPLMTCNKTKCQCGLCAPKAHDRDTLISVMKKHLARSS